MNNKYTINDLKKWKSNPLINPKTNKIIKKDGPTFKIIEREYFLNKQKIESKIFSLLNKLLICEDDRDPISMSLFWIEKDNTKSIVYPLDQLDNLVFYSDNQNKVRCLEQESIIYLKTYNFLKHPVTMETLPKELFDSIKVINIENNKVSINDFALNVFQIFTKKSIFIDSNLFLQLNKDELIKFNNEIKDIWIQNLTPAQRGMISNESLFFKHIIELNKYSLEELQNYSLKNIKIALECNKEELSLMINYIIIGALGIVIPQIKENYSDVIFAFS
jgi:hypothetical protein